MLLFFQNIGEASKWGEVAGINGYVLFALCSVMILLFGLLSWQFKRNDSRIERMMAQRDKRDSEFVNEMKLINEVISKNNMYVATELVKSNERALELKKDIALCIDAINEIKANNKRFITDTSESVVKLMDKVGAKLDIVTKHLEANHSTITAMNESIRSTNNLIQNA